MRLRRSTEVDARDVAESVVHPGVAPKNFLARRRAMIAASARAPLLTSAPARSQEQRARVARQSDATERCDRTAHQSGVTERRAQSAQSGVTERRVPRLRVPPVLLVLAPGASGARTGW